MGQADSYQVSKDTEAHFIFLYERPKAYQHTWDFWVTGLLTVGVGIIVSL